MSCNSKWIALNDIPNHIYYATATIDYDGNIIMATRKYSDEKGDQGIYKYFLNQKKWKKIVGYPHHMIICWHSISLNKKNIYLTSLKYTMTIFNRSNMELKLSLDKNSCKNGQTAFSTTINVNDEIHVIGGSPQKHLIWNDDNNSFKHIHTFNERKIMRNPAVVFISSKNIIIMIHSQDGFNPNGYIWKYDVILKQWEIIKDVTYKNTEYTQIGLICKENYIIITGALHSDEICLMDIKDNYKIKKCKVYCPFPGRHNMVITGSGLREELLVNAWIKNTYKSPKFKNSIIPPTYIILLIKNWYSMEMLHLMQRTQEKNNNKHFVIKTKDILESLS